MIQRPQLMTLYGALLAALAVYGFAVDSSLTRTYLIITVALTALILGIDRSVRFPTGVLAALASVAVGNMAGGVLLIGDATLYLTEVLGSLRYDKVFHFYATAVGAVASWAALRRWAGSSRMTPGLAACTFLMAMGAGALVEVVEYVGTLVVPNANVGDYGNNMLDLVANMGGSAAGVAYGKARSNRG